MRTSIPHPRFPAHSDTVFVRIALPASAEFFDELCEALLNVNRCLEIARREGMERRFADIRSPLENVYDEMNVILKQLSD
jgi:hypothetical protein